MNESVYQTRKAILDRLPDCFLLRELRAAGGLSVDGAWQTCRRWQAEGILSGEQGFYRKSCARLALPESFHRAAAGGAIGYFTGLAALSVHGFWPECPVEVDFVARNRSRSCCRFRGQVIRYHRLARASAPLGLERVRDGGREFILAGVERVVADVAAYPDRFFPLGLMARILRQRRRVFRQSRLLDLALGTGSETAARRMRVLAECAGMKRLPAWLGQRFTGSRMGRVVLDPGAALVPGCPVRHGVWINLPEF